MVYHIAGSATDPRFPLKHEEILEPIDGDLDRINVIDPTPDGGRVIRAGGSGRAIDLENIPTRLRRKGNEGCPLHDVRDMWGGLLVNETFRDVVESAEPGIHQFSLILVEQKGKVIFERFYFNICNRLDSLAKAECVPPVEEGRMYRPAMDPTDKIVFDSAKIGSCHAWHDKFALSRLVSDELFSAIESAGFTGLGSKRYDEV